MNESIEKLELLVSDKLKELRIKTQELFEIKIDPTISYDLRGQAAGQANYRHNVIRLNRELLGKYTADFVDQTIPHEFAHLVAHQVYGRRIKPHGKEWKSVVLSLGAKPVRTHSYEVTPTRRLKRFRYQCDCQGSSYEITSVRHNRILRGHIYLCKKCGSPLRHQADV